MENHPGAGSTAAPALVAHAPPDGYTLLINTSAQAYSAARAGELPDVPPLTQAGVAGFDFPIWYGIWAPAQTPASIVSTLARDITDTLATPELSEWLTQHDADPMHMSPARFGAFVVSEAQRAAALLSTP